MTVDVFTHTALLGNPVAVVLGADGLSDAQMQAFARWTHDVSGGILDPRKVESGIKRVVNRPPTGEVMRDFAQSGDPAAVLARLADLPAEARALFLLPYAMTAYVAWRTKEAAFRRAAGSGA